MDGMEEALPAEAPTATGTAPEDLPNLKLAVMKELLESKFSMKTTKSGVVQMKVKDIKNKTTFSKFVVQAPLTLFKEWCAVFGIDLPEGKMTYTKKSSGLLLWFVVDAKIQVRERPIGN